MSRVPYGIVPERSALNYLAVEVSWGSAWTNINDGERFRVGSEGTRDNVNKTYRKTVAESPILGGNYLIHAVPDMVTESVSVWVYGTNQTDLNDNYYMLEELFSQMDFRIRWTLDEYVETWRCQLSEMSSSRAQVYTHARMAKMAFQVPRYPDVTRETSF